FSVLPPLRPLLSLLFPYTTLFRSAYQPVVFFLHRRARRELHPRRFEWLRRRQYHRRSNRSGFPGTGGTGFLRDLVVQPIATVGTDRKSTRLNSSHRTISYAVFCLK